MLRYALFIAALACGAAAAAEEISYSYIGASYQRVELDDFDVDGDGYGAGGSVAIADSWFIAAGLSSGDFDFDVDFEEWSIGGGWHRPITPNTDFFAALSYVRVDIGVGPASADDDGFGAAVGVRSMVSDALELTGSISHAELDDSGGNTALNAGAWYLVSGNFAVGLGASFDDDATSYGIGIRLYFDK